MAELQLLGSGSADGWPNPWCACRSCRWARATGNLRARTAALLDRRVLIDPGPDLTTRPRADLTGVELVLVSHAHPDHFDPAFLLARSWSQTAADLPALVVAGPATVIEAARLWVAPDSAVRFIELAAGDTLEHAGWQVRALPAAHNLAGTNSYDGTALLYELADQQARILWATDTAALPHPDLAGPYNLVALDLTHGERTDHGSAHLDLPSFAVEVAILRANGQLAADATVVAVHLSHHNPPELPERLAPLGAVAGTDMAVYHVPTRPARVFVTGGARSGKSRRAEALAGQISARSGRAVTYVATAPEMPGDPEWAMRVATHRSRRPEGWRTRETADLVGVLAAATTSDLLLIDCLTLWLTHAIDAARAWDDPGLAHRAADEAVTALLVAMSRASCGLILVSNEVGSGIVPATASGRLFQDLLGQANSRIATACDQVELLVAGHPIQLRGC
jgi:adenosylcobinamide kinase/adenosylcobinamide-phosphate guanylyltransferase